MPLTTTVVVPLVGVVLGSTGAILAQYIGTRVTKQQARAAAGAQRCSWKRKEAIREFLDAAQSVEQAAEQRSIEGQLPNDISVRIHRMWFQRKCIQLICSTQLSEAAQNYSWCMYRSCYRDLPHGIDVWAYLHEGRDPFMVLARRELRIREPDQIVD